MTDEQILSTLNTEEGAHLYRLAQAAEMIRIVKSDGVIESDEPSHEDYEQAVREYLPGLRRARGLR